MMLRKRFEKTVPCCALRYAESAPCGVVATANMAAYHGQMETYDPHIAPEPEAWLALDEAGRQALVELYHEDVADEIESATLHAAIHTVVENQLAMQIPDVQQTLTRLLASGLDRHDAIHAIGSVLAEHMFDVMKANTPASNSKYYRALKKLTAKAWHKRR